MAQACVLSVQRNMEGPTEQQQQQQCMLTPAQPSSPDPSFITSSVRKEKRKEPRDGDAAPLEKRVCVESAPSVPAAAVLPVAQEEPCPNGGEGPSAEGEGILFSPSFHLIDKEGAEAVAPSRPSTPPGDNASTDASTGTSASLDQGESSGQAAATAVPSTAAAVNIPTSPGGTLASPAHTSAVATANQAAAAVEEEDEDEEWEFDPYLFIKRLPALEQCINAPRTSFLLPRQTRHSKRKTLVLDLDETLVHSTLDGDCTPDFTFAVQMGPARHMVAVRMRPHLHTFLKRVAELFEVVVFTASQQIYAEQLLDIIDPGEKCIKHRVYRDSCVLWEGNYLKDLTVLGRDLAHTLIVDNSPQAFGFQLANGVPIESWYDDDEDTELLKLIPFLEIVAAANDVRPHIEQTFRLKELVEASPLPTIISPGQHYN
jgi:CTD small phosphatase-like protein 2